MAASRPRLRFRILFLSFACFLYIKNYDKAHFEGILLLLVQGAFLLCFTGWLLSVLNPSLKSFSSLFSSGHREDEGAKQKQEARRKEQQEQHQEKASRYQESVLKPRQEEKLMKRKERFYRMVGEEWKRSRGHRLREREPEPSDDHLEHKDVYETPNVAVIRRRKLPENVNRVAPDVHLPKEKVVVLPDEPSEHADGVVRVVLRCPGGRTIKRRFLKSHSSLVLLDWMLRSGYPPDIYTVCTSYPRHSLQTGEDLSLAAAGLDTDTVLNIEETDSYTT